MYSCMLPHMNFRWILINGTSCLKFLIICIKRDLAIIIICIVSAVALPTSSDDPNREELIKAKERAILMLGGILSKYGFAEGMIITSLVHYSC